VTTVLVLADKYIEYSGNANKDLSHNGPTPGFDCQ